MVNLAHVVAQLFLAKVKNGRGRPQLLAYCDMLENTKGDWWLQSKYCHQTYHAKGSELFSCSGWN
ncbi:hypothetical protein KDK_32810 [Dictyobacter kobayashii]|uniref:Uncharacterized protein n=1 Tax=Dictyobacter kobayashii TaxID=2014872 RepID=A0A402AK35_9CHLR|nr:hypothetical protein KDK_32810 [Dictyobacter kobayashii]